MDHLDPLDLLVIQVSLVYMDHLVGLEPKNHLNKREEEELLDHKENQDYQETMSTHIVLHQEARGLEEHLVFQDDQDIQEFPDLREMLACLLMVLLVSQVNLECLEKMEKMDDQDCQVDRVIKVLQV